jgi:hypothetical protein
MSSKLYNDFPRRNKGFKSARETVNLATRRLVSSCVTRNARPTPPG